MVHKKRMGQMDRIKEKLKQKIICCDTCKNKCCNSTDCLIVSSQYAVQFILGEMWESDYYYRYVLWKPNIPESYLSNDLFEI